MRKKIILSILSILSLLLLIIVHTIDLKADDTTTITIDPQKQFQKIEGWGTSLAWWGNAIGNWQDADKKSEIESLIFDQQSGLGLNLIRYNIGGGENPSHDHMRVCADIPGYEPEEGNWNWTADSGQLEILKSAVAYGANRLEAFCNSPPYWMTYSKCAAGSQTGLSNNLYDDAYDNYANYISDVLLYLKDHEGITFRTLSPLNEPSSNWWKAYNNQEGCRYDQGRQEMLIREMGDKLNQKGLSVQISAPEEYSLNQSNSTYNSYGQSAKELIKQVNTHTYSGTDREGLRRTAALSGNRLWVSEIGVGGTEPHNHNDLSSAMQLASEIVTDVRDMGVDGWVYWQAVEDEAGNNNYGFLHANFSGSEDYWITKQYYAMANFSKFIRPGAIILDAGNDSILAAYHPVTKTISVVLVNSSNSNINYALDFSKFTNLSNQFSVYRTSQSENCQKIDLNSTIPETKQISITANADSITTIEINDAEYNGYNSINDNLIGSKNNMFLYTGNWDYYNAQVGAYDRDNHYSENTGDSAKLRFWGTGLKIYSAKANNHGIMSIQVDDQEVAKVDCYASVRADGVEVYAMDNLEPGYHTITMSVTGEKNPASEGTFIVVDRIDVINSSSQMEPEPEVNPSELKNNIALGCVAVADSTQSGNEPFKAVDGNLESRWCADDGNTGHWIKFDFGRLVNLSGGEITFGIPEQYTIEGSSDGTKWDTIYVQNSYFNRQTQPLSFTATGIQYIRVTVDQLQPGAWASIDDIKFYSDSYQNINDNTTVPTANHFTYAGSWKYNWYEGNAYLQDNHYSNNQGDSYELTFYGNSIELFAAKAPNHGIADVSIDGGLPVSVDLYSAERQDDALIFEQSGLANEEHRLKVTVSGKSNVNSSDKFITADHAIIK